MKNTRTEKGERRQRVDKRGHRFWRREVTREGAECRGGETDQKGRTGSTLGPERQQRQGWSAGLQMGPG